MFFHDFFNQTKTEGKLRLENNFFHNPHAVEMLVGPSTVRNAFVAKIRTEEHLRSLIPFVHAKSNYILISIILFIIFNPC